MKDKHRIYIPSISHRYTVVSQTQDFGQSLYFVQIFNGSPIDTILEQDHVRMIDGLDSFMKYCTRRGDDLWNLFEKNTLTHNDIIARIILSVSFEVFGSYVVQITLPDFFHVQKTPGNFSMEFLDLGYHVEPQLNIIEKIRSSS